MKQETYANKLNELLGIAEDTVAEVKKKINARKGNVQGVSEEEIALFREREGIIYFLQAPELFHARVCKQCETPFLVSRLHVAYCSYQCLDNRIFEETGMRWSRKNDLELMVAEVWENNEPIIIRNLPTLHKALSKLTEALGTESEPSENLTQKSKSLSTQTSPSAMSTRSLIPPIPRVIPKSG